MNDAERVVTDDDGIIAFVNLNEMFIARCVKLRSPRISPVRSRRLSSEVDFVNAKTADEG